MAKTIVGLALMGIIVSTCLELNAHSMANGTGEIIGIHMSPDNKKLLIKVEGSVALRESFISAEPRLLVLDFDAAGFVDIQPVTRFKDGPVKIIQTDTRGASQRIFVDFRGPVAPEYRIKRIGSFFIVLFDEEDVMRAQAQAAAYGASEQTGGNVSSQSQWNSLSSPDSNIMISNSVVENDRILLQVIDKRNPAKRYNVTLDIDFKTLGFNSASVKAVKNETPLNRLKKKKASKKRKPRSMAQSRKNKRPRSDSIRVNFGPEDEGLFNAFESGPGSHLQNGSHHAERTSHQRHTKAHSAQ